MLSIPHLRKLVKTADIFVKGCKSDYPAGRVMEAKEYYIDDYDDDGFMVSDKETEEQFHVDFRDVLEVDDFK